MRPRSFRISSENNIFQHADVLRRNRQKRTQYREFFLEGVRPINLALQHGWTINAYFHGPYRALSDWALGILKESTAQQHVELSMSLLEKLSGKTQASELLAIVSMPEDRLSRIPLGDNPLIVIVDRPSSPGNLGTLIRSCDALGVHGTVIIGHAVDLYDPEVITASRGSLFALPVIRSGGPNDLQPWLQEIRESAPSLQIVASAETAECDIWNNDFRRPTVLLLGNEKWGLSEALRDMADVSVRIPMEGAASSLNVAVAGGIVLYEIKRQRAVLQPSVLI